MNKKLKKYAKMHIQNIVLGCTHYNYIKTQIKNALIQNPFVKNEKNFVVKERIYLNNLRNYFNKNINKRHSMNNDENYNVFFDKIKAKIIIKKELKISTKICQKKIIINYFLFSENIRLKNQQNYTTILTTKNQKIKFYESSNLTSKNLEKILKVGGIKRRKKSSEKTLFLKSSEIFI